MKLRPLQIGAVLLPTLLLGGCFHEADEDHDMHNDGHQAAMFQVKVTNLTNHQPMTPPAVVFHNGEYTAWEAGSMASTALEKLAEAGDTSEFISDAEMNDDVYATSTLSSAPFGPGESVMTTVEVHSNHTVEVSVASMLANTNDAFTGVDGIDLAPLAMGESVSVMTMAYDAGTEANSESAGTIPGPVDGGTGFDATRDDKDFIAIHPGVVTMDDRLSTSVLDESHRWLGVVAKIEVTRVQ